MKTSLKSLILQTILIIFTVFIFGLFIYLGASSNENQDFITIGIPILFISFIIIGLLIDKKINKHSINQQVDRFYVMKKEIEEERQRNRDSDNSSSTFFKVIFYLICIIGYLLNLYSIFLHWNDVLTVGRLAELVGVIIFPIGIILGWINML